MRLVLITTATAALIAVAACNRAEEPSAQTETGPVSQQPTGGGTDQPAPVLTAEEAYGVRHERFEEIGDNLKVISRELKGGSPDIGDVRTRAERIAELAPQVVGWFPVGSGPDRHPKSRAKANVFEDEPAFRQAAQRFVEASRGFELAARSGEIANIRAALPELGGACKNCHDRFRGPER